MSTFDYDPQLISNYWDMLGFGLESQTAFPHLPADTHPPSSSTAEADQCAEALDRALTGKFGQLH